jgi:apolipoprotein N-acyltransferase
LLLAGAAVLRLWAAAQAPPAPPASALKVAGVQMEFPTLPEVLSQLDDLATRVPDAQLLVLSEYTFTEPLPDKVKAWCRRRERYLMVGHKQPAAADRFYNTVSVISPEGKEVFSQVKSVPIQFFNDGMPAASQSVWDSPWGKLGICICYDLSYSRVTDRLVRMGAEALIVPTMDVVDWGARQHELHARMAPLRSAEYGLGIFRVASSGISQLTDGCGAVLASAPFGEEGSRISGSLPLKRGGARVPPDRVLAQVSVGLCGAVLLKGMLSGRRKQAA